MVNIFQTLGMERRSLVFAIIRKLVLEIPLIFLLERIYPLYGLASAQCVTEMLMAALAVTMLLRIFREA